MNDNQRQCTVARFALGLYEGLLKLIDYNDNQLQCIVARFTLGTYEGLLIDYLSDRM